MTILHDFFFYLLYQPLLNALVFFAWLIPGHSMGWAIIALTIVIRLILLPSTIKTLEQQQKLRAIQPKLDELKKSHGHDRTAHSKATMELYAAEKVSPFGSCLPTLIQVITLPVLYQVFIKGLNTDQYQWLYSFTPRMAAVNVQWFGLDLSKPELWILPITAGVLQYIQMRQMAAVTPSTGDPNDVSQLMQKQMTFIFPIMMVVIGRQVPAALSLYYAVFALFSVIQQAYYFRQPAKASTKSVAKAGGSKLAKAGGVTVTVRKKGQSGGEDDTK
jgi:YidC/Oxa1 family membrane protein insertase